MIILSTGREALTGARLPDDLPDHLRESHVHQSICLVEDEVADLLEVDLTAAQEILDPARCADENVAA
jgi:hypothetical protein